MLEGLQAKYDKEFVIVGSENYETVGTLDVFTCTVSSVDNSDDIANARVTQRGEATDDYAKFYFSSAISEICVSACESKD